MRRLVLMVLVTLACSSYSQAEEVRWYDWNEGQILAEAQNKPMMVFIHASWCHVCQRMDTRVFTDADVATSLNKNFIPVRLDAEFDGELVMGGKTFTISELLGEITGNQFRGIPAYVFIPDKSSKKNTLIAGLKDPREMSALLKKFK